MKSKKKKLYLGLDLGGTGAKAGVFDCEGRMIGFGHSPYKPEVSAEGHVEIPVETIYNGARKAAREAIQKNGQRVAAMAISSQGETFVSLDEKGQALHKAIVWYDSRAGEQALRMKESYIAAFKGRKKQGLAAAPRLGFSEITTAPKIVWLREHFPAMMRRARLFLLLPDYFSYRLTGRAATDLNTAGSTSLFHGGLSDYDRIALSVAGIDREQLADILAPGERIAGLSASAAAEWRLSPGTLLVAGTNDQYAGALGAGNYKPDIVTETMGTCQALVTLARELSRPLPEGLYGGRFPIRQFEFALAYSKTAGVVLDWFNRELCGSDFNELVKEAAKVPIGCRGLTTLPHFEGVVSPRLDPSARGAFACLTLKHTRADMFRAILEALAFNTKENIDLFKRHGLRPKLIRAIGGGAKNDLWLQMKADITGISVERPVVTEAAVLGAAMLAAYGCGDFQSLSESSRKLYHVRSVFKPNSKNSRAYEEAYKRYSWLDRQLAGCGQT